MTALDIGLAFDLRSDQGAGPGAPIDALEEYDTQETIDAVAAALSGLGHRPRLLGGGRACAQALLERPPQLVFNLAEGRGSRSREAHIPALCEMLAVPCTHSDPLTMALTLDKALAKNVVGSVGVRTPAFQVVETASDLEGLDLAFPLFVKPVAEGSSMGVRLSSRVADATALRREVDRCLGEYREPCLVETYLPGAEVTVALLGSGRGARVIGAMEIAPASEAAETFVYGLETKRSYKELVRYHAPPRTLTREQCVDASQAALTAYRALGCRDVARIDLRFDARGRANFLEANPLPGLNPVTSDIVLLMGLLGIGFQALVSQILEEALRRNPGLNHSARR
jgi:D-alanine-D-alanine ligase